MPPYDDFFDTLLPGNYALTKSMELTRVTNSGTLWYTKKFLTLYYYVFLSNDIETSAYRPAVVEIFDRYIASLPEAVRESAERFSTPMTAPSTSSRRTSTSSPILPAAAFSAPRRSARSICAARRSTILPC